jgi:hypothetical protein
LLDSGIRAFVYDRDEQPPPGYVVCDVLTTEHDVIVEAKMDGEVRRVLRIDNKGFLIPLETTPLDLLVTATVLVKFAGNIGTKGVKSLSEKAAANRQPRNVLDGPNQTLARSEAAYRQTKALSVRKTKMSAPIKGKPDATDPRHAAREQKSADTFAAKSDVTEVYIGQEAKKEFGATVGEKFPDVVARKNGDRFGLGEGKGTDMKKAKEQFEAAGKRIGPGKIDEQHVVIERYKEVDGHISPGPGFRVDDLKRLEEFDSGTGKWVLVTPNGKPVTVILMSP